MRTHSITMLGTGLIGDFYTMTLHGQRGGDRVRVVYSRTEERGTGLQRTVGDSGAHDRPRGGGQPPRHRCRRDRPAELPPRGGGRGGRRGAARRCCAPSRSAAMPRRRTRILETVEKAGVFGGYLECLAYTPKTLKALASVEAGALGDVTWVRSRETHPGPHSAWFWDGRLTGGGAIIDLGCHCIEVIRGFVGKGNRPLEVLCHTDTLVHPIDDEDNAVALIRFESGAIGQFEVSWTFRGGMDLRDEVAGTHGTIWLNHFLRTGFDMFTSGGSRRLRGREGRDERRLALPGRRRGQRARLRRHVQRHVRRDRRWARPARDAVRRLRGERDHGRLLSVGEEPGLGAGRALRVARRQHGAHRQPAGDCTTARSSSSARRCPTAARS